MVWQFYLHTAVIGKKQPESTSLLSILTRETNDNLGNDIIINFVFTQFRDRFAIILLNLYTQV